MTELLDEQNRQTDLESGEQARRIVATGFWNYAMPLIRYDTGDIVYFSGHKCQCLRQFPTIRRIMGREGDLITTPSGKVYGPAVLTYFVRGTRNVLESQIIQDRPDHITIEYVVTDKFNETDLKDFHLSIQGHISSELHYTLRQVDRVERTQSGKIRPVVSKIKS
jgi:phenylacetate-CoA ligase